MSQGDERFWEGDEGTEDGSWRKEAKALVLFQDTPSPPQGTKLDGPHQHRDHGKKRIVRKLTDDFFLQPYALAQRC